ncbi:MAG: beta-phosphoglucomutase [Granulosicoccus sp.]|jgi:beta-phosphoglucomutase
MSNSVPTEDDQRKACIFDLDGVIVDTAKYHFVAWRNLANSLGFDFTEKENEKLKGVSRVDSLNLILGWGGMNFSEKIKTDLAFNKNEDYLTYIKTMDASEILPNVVGILEEIKKLPNYKIGLGSASKNAKLILDQVGLTKYFDFIVDGSMVTHGKPHPEGFLLAAAEMNVLPKNCIVFEDAPKGVEAALAAEMFAVGIGSEDDLGDAHLVMADFSKTTFAEIEEKFLALV